MEQSPVCVAKNKKQIATFVEALQVNRRFFGFQDGAVLLSKSIVKRCHCDWGSTGAEVTAIVVPNSRSHILIGDTEGNILWAPLGRGLNEGDVDRKRPDPTAVQI